MHRPAYCPRCGGETRDQSIDGTTRPVCSQCGFTIFLDPKLAVAVVIEQEGKILLGLRAEGSRQPGKWSFPAGFVDRGERVEAAAAREIREETGIQIGSLSLLELISSDGEPVVLVVYIATSFDGKPQPGDDLAELGWFDPDELPPLAFAHDSSIVERWKTWRGNSEKGPLY